MNAKRKITNFSVIRPYTVIFSLGKRCFFFVCFSNKKPWKPWFFIPSRNKKHLLALKNSRQREVCLGAKKDKRNRKMFKIAKAKFDIKRGANAKYPKDLTFN